MKDGASSGVLLLPRPNNVNAVWDSPVLQQVPLIFRAAFLRHFR